MEHEVPHGRTYAQLQALTSAAEHEHRLPSAGHDATAREPLPCTHDAIKPESLATRIQALLAVGADPALSAIARQLGMSVRSLQRALAEQGTTYRHVADTARCTAAQRLLAETKLTLSQAAQKLGFSDLPAFHRAFQRWTGFTPGEFRAALR
jgi:AraC-like DNA-binding protein